MYRAFYGLQKKPFQISADPEFLWLGPKHKEGLATLIYGVSDNKGFLVLSGGVGTGKTTLIHALLRQLDDRVVVASVPDPGLSLIEFYRYVATSFGMKGKYTSKVDFLFDFEAFLKKMHAQGRVVLLIIDEAQRLNSAMLDEIRLLSNIEVPEQKLLNIFFVGQGEFLRVISSPCNRALKQRITINHHLSPLSLEETRMFIDYRLQVAGATRPIFEDDAIEGIYAFSHGHPRRINIICDHALLSGFVDERPTIGADIVAECAAELMLPGERPWHGHPPAANGNSRVSPSPPEKAPSSPPANSTAPAILGEAIMDKPASEPPPKHSPVRLVTLVTALLVTVITAFIYFKPQPEIAPPPERVKIAVVPSENAVKVAPEDLAREETPSADSHMERPDESTGPGKPVEFSDDHPVTPEAPREIAARTAPQDRTISEEIPGTPPASWLANADAIDPQSTGKPSTEPSAVRPIEAHGPAAPSSEKNDDRFDSPKTEDSRRPSPDIAVATASPQREDTPLSTAAIRSEPAPEVSSLPSDQDTLRGETPAPVDNDPTLVAGRAPETSDPPPQEAIAQASPVDIPQNETAPASPSLSGDQDTLRGETPAPVDNDPILVAGRAPEASAPPPSDNSEQTLPANNAQDKPGRIGGAAPATSLPAPSAPSLSNARSPLVSDETPTGRNVAVATPQPTPVDQADTAPDTAADAEPRGLTTAERLKKFLQTYCQAYSARDLERFTALFAPNAVERDKPFIDLIPTYRSNFEKLDEVNYQIDMLSYSENDDGSEIRIQGDFRLLYRMEGRDWKAFGGDIEMDLVKMDNIYRVKRLDYQKRN